MRFADLEGSDRHFAVTVGVLASLLMAGLMVTGFWHFTVYRPQPQDIQFFNGKPFLVDRPDLATEIHSVLADLSAILALIVAAWFSYRVLARISAVGLLSFIVLAATVVGGAGIVTNQIVERKPSRTGDESTYEIDRVPDALALALHIASIPAVIALIACATWRSRRRRQLAGEPDPTWLDRLDI